MRGAALAHRSIFILLSNIFLTVSGSPINRQAGISENVYITTQNDTYGIEQRVCSIDSMTYEDGESIPTSSPCEHCICRPPGFACTIISCEYRPGCKALKRSDQCCPEYQCECEKDGKIYQNGEKILDDNNPCEVCYCQGGDVICAVIDCYWRSDCQPRYIENRCCPLYDHCPPPSPIDIGPIRSTPSPTSTTTLSSHFSWLNSNSSIYATKRPIPPSTTLKNEPISIETEGNSQKLSSTQWGQGVEKTPSVSHENKNEGSKPNSQSQEINNELLPNEKHEDKVQNLEKPALVSSVPKNPESVVLEPTVENVNKVSEPALNEELNISEVEFTSQSTPINKEPVQETLSTVSNNFSQSIEILETTATPVLSSESPQIVSETTVSENEKDLTTNLSIILETTSEKVSNEPVITSSTSFPSVETTQKSEVSYDETNIDSKDTSILHETTGVLNDEVGIETTSVDPKVQNYEIILDNDENTTEKIVTESSNAGDENIPTSVSLIESTSNDKSTEEANKEIEKTSDAPNISIDETIKPLSETNNDKLTEELNNDIGITSDAPNILADEAIKTTTETIPISLSEETETLILNDDTDKESQFSVTEKDSTPTASPSESPLEIEKETDGPTTYSPFEINSQKTSEVDVNQTDGIKTQDQSEIYESEKTTEVLPETATEGLQNSEILPQELSSDEKEIEVLSITSSPTLPPSVPLINQKESGEGVESYSDQILADENNNSIGGSEENELFKPSSSPQEVKTVEIETKEQSLDTEEKLQGVENDVVEENKTEEPVILPGEVPEGIPLKNLTSIVQNTEIESTTLSNNEKGIQNDEVETIVNNKISDLEQPGYNMELPTNDFSSGEHMEPFNSTQMALEMPHFTHLVPPVETSKLEEVLTTLGPSGEEIKEIDSMSHDEKIPVIIVDLDTEKTESPIVFETILQGVSSPTTSTFDENISEVTEKINESEKLVETKTEENSPNIVLSDEVQTTVDSILADDAEESETESTTQGLEIIEESLNNNVNNSNKESSSAEGENPIPNDHEFHPSPSPPQNELSDSISDTPTENSSLNTFESSTEPSLSDSNDMPTEVPNSTDKNESKKDEENKNNFSSDDSDDIPATESNISNETVTESYLLNDSPTQSSHVNSSEIAKEENERLNLTVSTEESLNKTSDEPKSEFRLDLSIFDEDGLGSTISSVLANELVFDEVSSSPSSGPQVSQTTLLSNDFRAEAQETTVQPGDNFETGTEKREEAVILSGNYLKENHAVELNLKKTPILIPPELIKKVEPISDDLGFSKESRSDLRSDADNEVAQTDETWYGRTFDRIRSLFPQKPPHSSRRPRRSLDFFNFPSFIFW